MDCTVITKCDFPPCHPNIQDCLFTVQWGDLLQTLFYLFVIGFFIWLAVMLIKNVW